jgi:energy-coupling factor transport system permease protein
MHPAIRIISVVITIVFLAHPEPGVLLFVAAMVLALLLVKRGMHFHSLLRYIRGLRWLLLAILVLYLWMTPGMPLFDTTLLPHYLVPSREGLIIALQRVASLLLIVSLVALLLLHTAREDLLAALCWLTRPLRVLKLDNERLSLRLILVLELVPAAKNLVTAAMRVLAQTRPGMDNFSRVFSNLYRQVLAQADTSGTRDVVIPVLPAPTLWQWLLPACLVVIFVTLLKVL